MNTQREASRLGLPLCSNSAGTTIQNEDFAVWNFQDK